MALTSTNAMSYQAAKQVSKPTKAGIRVISEMSTARILAYVAYRHRVGLLAMTTVALVGYIVYDKLLSMFF